MSNTLKAAIDYWHTLLREQHLESTAAGLGRALEERKLSFLERSIASVLRPHFVVPDQHRREIAATTLVARGLTAIAKRVVGDPALLAELGLSEEEMALARAEPGGVTEIYSRLDGFVGADGVIRFLEFNSMGAGLVFEAELETIYSRLPIFEAFTQRYAVEPLGGVGFLVDGICKAFARRGHSGRPRITLVSRGQQDSLMMWSESVRMVEAIRAGGCELRVARIEELECRDGIVRVGDVPVDALFCDDWAAFLEVFALSHPLWTSVREGRLWLANSPAGRLVRGNKRLFALLSDPEHTQGLAPELRDALARHIPWTRAVRDGRTTFRGESVELLPLLERRRHELVLKPALDHGGRGVVLGAESDDAQWRVAIQEALQRRYVVQERVATTAESFPVVVDGDLRFEPHFVDVNPFVWNEDHGAGWLVRLSKAALMNLSAGQGSLTPTFVVRPR